MKHPPKPGYPGLFIDDLDPYAEIGDAAIPAPASIELDTQEAWDDFQDSVAAFLAPAPTNTMESAPPGGKTH